MSAKAHGSATPRLLRPCPACGAQNRVPADRLPDRGRCGACKGDLPPVAEPLPVDAADFEAVTRGARVPVLVDFWAEWCGPCRAVAPQVAAVARELAGRALVLKVDTEQHPDLAARHDVRAIPTFLVFRNGRVVRREAGVAPAAVLRQWLEASLVDD